MATSTFASLPAASTEKKKKKKKGKKKKDSDYFVCKVLWPQYPYSVSALFTKQYQQIFLMFPSVVLNLVFVTSTQNTTPCSHQTTGPGCPADDHHRSPRHWLVFVLSSAFLFVLVPCVPWMTYSVSGENPLFNQTWWPTD